MRRRGAPNPTLLYAPAACRSLLEAQFSAGYQRETGLAPENSASFALAVLLRYLQEKVSVSGSEGWKESVPLLPEDILLPRENSIPLMPSLPQDVRILSLPRLTVAAAHAIKMGDFHEWAALAGWAEQSPDWEIRWASDGTEIMGGSLEEHLNYLQDRAAGRLQTGQLDLLLPIQKRRESQ